MFTQPGDTENDIYLIENLPLTMPAGIAADRRGQVQRRWMASVKLSWLDRDFRRHADCVRMCRGAFQDLSRIA